MSILSKLVTEKLNVGGDSEGTGVLEYGRLHKSTCAGLFHARRCDWHNMRSRFDSPTFSMRYGSGVDSLSLCRGNRIEFDGTRCHAVTDSSGGTLKKTSGAPVPVWACQGAVVIWLKKLDRPSRRRWLKGRSRPGLSEEGIAGSTKT